MRAEYVAHMGDDLMVANTARVSFKKYSEEFGEGDENIIKYLAAHNHWTPFAHPQIQIRMSAPVPIRTQCFKHKQGFVENEESRRYIDSEPEFFMPDGWRGRPTNGAKQGSSDELIKTIVFHGTVESWETEIDDVVGLHYETSLNLYNSMIKGGVCPEQARFVLPQGMMVSWIWTGSLAAYSRFYKQRTDPHAQKEIQELAGMVGKIIEPLFPISWRELTK